MAKWVYMFSEGDMTMRNLLGGKGANLAEMTSIGLPVPQGFTITTEACTQYYEDGRKINDEIMAQTMEGVKKMEELNGKKFGDLKNPLLVSVRSGARASMPGMMDTILNLGLNDEVVAAMIAGNPDPKFERFVYDSYRRFIQMFSDVVMEVGKKYFEQLIDKMKEEKGVQYDIELTAADLKTLAEQFKAEYKKQLGEDFPSDPVVQLKLAIEAVFRSWDNPRANVYRRDNDIPYSWGTAVNVMPMVFGNLNDESGTGVAFTRDPATGEKKLMGEFLKNAQGEDVVAGVRTPMPIAQMEQEFPEAYADFIKVCDVLENHYHDMQDMEFTVENRKLYMLQCRNGKRTAQAALQIACDLVDEGHKTEEEAVAMIDPRNLDTLLHPQFDAAALKAATPLGKGLGASPGAACGKVVFTAEDAEKWAEKGEKVVLVRLETSPEDITGMKVAQGILTVRGGMTSHAAVVARGMGTCCVSGCGDITMDEANKKFTLAGKEYHEGENPVNNLSFIQEYDVYTPGQDFLFTSKDNIFVAWKVGEPVTKMQYIRKSVLQYEKEWLNGLTWKSWIMNQNNEAAGTLQYIKRDESGNLYHIKDFTTSEIGTQLRFAPGERAYNGRSGKESVFNLSKDAPVFKLSHQLGIKGVLGGDYNYNHTEISAEKRIWLSSFGHIDAQIKAGKVWDKVPFPLLILPNTNQSITIQPEAFHMMNALEFVTDQYVSFNATYYLKGWILNRIPGIKWLRLREVLSFNMIYGGLTDKNNPTLTPGLFLLPDGTQPLGSTPYMECSVGLENIFKILRIDYYRRLTYLDHPDIKKGGIRIALRFTF